MTFDESIENAQQRIRNSYTAVSEMGGTIPTLSSQTTYNLPDAIYSIPKGSEHRYAVASDVEWDDEWQQKGLSGTVFDVVVGDNLCPLLSVAIIVGNTSYTDPATVYWGDGTSTKMANTGSETRLYHAYQTAGHYELRVDNKARHVYFMTLNPTVNSWQNEIIFNTRSAIRCLKQIGSAITDLYCICYYLHYCNSTIGGYPANLPPIPPNATRLDSAFGMMYHYDGNKIPRLDHLTKAYTVRQMFHSMYYGNFELQKLPPNVTTAESTYWACRKVQYIPYDIFENCNNLTSVYGTFAGCVAVNGEYPKISHLTKIKTMAYLFYQCQQIGAGYDLPELPYAPELTTMQNTFYYNCGASGSNSLRLSERVPNVTTMRDCFNSCWAMRSKPDIPSSVTAQDGLYRTFTNCQSMQGEFPELPTGYKGSMYETFRNCSNLSGQIKPFPDATNNIYATYYNCFNATGHFPALDNISSLVGVDSARSTFTGCYRVSEPPSAFLNVDFMNSSASQSTNFIGMFQQCHCLSSFPFDLSGYTKITNCQEMFRDCIGLEYHPMTLPVNLTSQSYMFSNCWSLTANLPQWTSKVTNAGYCYQWCANMQPMLDADGNIETTPSKIYNSKITTYTNLATSSSPQVQKQIYDACVASGKSGNLYGVVNANWR